MDYGCMFEQSGGLPWADIDKTWCFTLASWCEQKELPNVVATKNGRKWASMWNLILNTMRLYVGTRDNMDGTNACYQWASWFDTTNELLEIKYVVHFSIRKQVNDNVNKSQEGCWKPIRLSTISGKI